MLTFCLFIAITFALCCGLAQAQMYRCESNGRVAFQDTPCAARERSTSVSAGSSGTASGTDNRVATRYYDVDGNGYQTLLESLRRNSPTGYHGFASWRVNYRYDFAREGNLCRITSIRFTLDGEIMLPRWRPSTPPDAELVRRWERYLAALQRHEQGHVQHGEELVVTARQRILANGAQACEALEARTQGSFARVLEAMQGRDREYDERTGHGATQGARF